MSRLSIFTHLLLLSTIAIICSAQQTVDIFGFFEDLGQPLYGSILTQHAETTTFVLQCIPNPSSICLYMPTTPVTYTSNPSSVHFADGTSADIVMGSTVAISSSVTTVNCNMTGTTEATCITTQDNALWASTYLATNSVYFSLYVNAVTLTDSLPAPGATAAGSSAGSTTPGSSSTSSAIPASTSSVSQAPQTTSAASSASSASTALGGSAASSTSPAVASTTKAATPSSTSAAVASTTKASNAVGSSQLNIAWKVAGGVGGAIPILMLGLLL